MAKKSYRYIWNVELVNGTDRRDNEVERVRAADPEEVSQIVKNKGLIGTHRNMYIGHIWRARETKNKMAKKSKSLKIKKPKVEYSLEISYDPDHYFKYGIDDKDGPEKLIPKLVGGQEGGTGMGFGQRDMSFYFKTRRQAVAAHNRIKKSPLKRRFGIKYHGITKFENDFPVD